ncbi:hypothetical protein Aca07nite_29820 [Actinoplanes capillaceus]|uniref:Uncharacterized protein n=1 Tax=Actinoplanes campanulatus TaxID=113559 RepID=A0ABQ3WHK6_9ACTN|nr:hypothetical protein Aca07nite_29820 [Actinoplanes capillaceus]
MGARAGDVVVAYLVYSGGGRARGGFRVRPPGLAVPRMTIAMTDVTAVSGQAGCLGSKAVTNPEHDRRYGRE